MFPSVCLIASSLFFFVSLYFSFVYALFLTMFLACLFGLFLPSKYGSILYIRLGYCSVDLSLHSLILVSFSTICTHTFFLSYFVFTILYMSYSFARISYLGWTFNRLEISKRLMTFPEFTVSSASTTTHNHITCAPPSHL